MRKIVCSDNRKNEKETNLQKLKADTQSKNSGAPRLTQIRGKQKSENNDYHVSPRAQESYASTAGKGSQMKASTGAKLDMGLKTETFEKLNGSNVTGLRHRPQKSKKSKDYGFGLELPDSLKSASKSSFTNNQPPNLNDTLAEEQKVDTKNSTIISRSTAADKIALKRHINQSSDSYSTETFTFSAFASRIGLGMGAVACLTMVMWWGQHNQQKYSHGVIKPKAAMMQSSSESSYRIIKERSKLIGREKVVFVDFLSLPSNLDFDRVMQELDSRLDQSINAYRFRFFSPSDSSAPFFDLFAKAKMDPTITEKFENNSNYRGLTVVWNKKADIGW